MAVAVEVARDAAVPLDGRVGVRPGTDVHESAAADVLEEGAPRQPAALLPPGRVGVGVGVDREEVEPAVVVVVEPAEAAAHHRVDVVCHPEAEVVLGEVQPSLPRDVGEANAGKPLCGGGEQRGACRRRRNYRERPAAADMRDEPAAFRSRLQLECLVQRCWRLPSDQGARGPRIARKLHRACQPGNRDRPALAVTRFEMDVHLIDPIRRHFDRAALCRVDLASQRVQFVADRGASEHAGSSRDQGRGLRLEVGDEFGCNPACRLLLEHRLDLARRQDRHLGEPPRVFERRHGGRGPCPDPGPCDRARVGDECGGAERDEDPPVEMEPRARARSGDARRRRSRARRAAPPSPRTPSWPARSGAPRGARSRRRKARGHACSSASSSGR